MNETILTTSSDTEILLSSNESGFDTRREQYAFHVTGSPVYLDITYFPDYEIDRPALQTTLLNAQVRFRRAMLTDINAPLQPDPYNTPRRAGENATLTAKSRNDVENGTSYKMKMSTGHDIAVSLYDFLYKGKRNGSAFMNVVDITIAAGPEKCGIAFVRPFED